MPLLGLDVVWQQESGTNWEVTCALACGHGNHTRNKSAKGMPLRHISLVKDLYS